MHHGKSRGKRFCRNLGGKCINYVHFPPKFQHDRHNLMFHFLKSSPRPPSRNKRSLLLRGGEGKEGGRGGERKGEGGKLLQGVRGDRRPCL